MSIRNKRPETFNYAKAQIHLADDKIDEIVENLNWLLELVENLGIADEKPEGGQSFREKVEDLKNRIRPQFSSHFGESLYATIVHLSEDLDFAQFGDGIYTQILPRSEWK